MVFGLLATEVPAERRSATLNLVYLPLYAAGIIGPILGAIVVGFGIWAPFAAASLVFIDGGLGKMPSRTAVRAPGRHAAI